MKHGGRVGWLGRLIGIDRVLEGQEYIVSVFSDAIQAAVDAQGQAATDAANRVIATINDNNSVIAALQATDAEQDALIAQLEAEIAANNVTPETAQALLDKMAATKAAIDAIDAAPVEPLPPVE
jgi:peptidoglycan hydrolase CwlO-like protein